MKILVLGHRGMLGQDLVGELGSRGLEPIGLDLPEFDITNPLAGAQLAAGKFGKLDWVVNCAAYTAVDRAESEPDEAMKVNALGPSYVARAGAIAGFRLLHISTDFVFDGRKTAPYREEDETNPQGAYARSKLEGENAVRQSGGGAVVVRTSWLFGPHGQSFPRTMIRAARAGKALRVVADQVGTPTYTADLARVLAELMARDPEPGVYHVAGPDIVSWHELTVRALRAYGKAVDAIGMDAEINPIRSEEWPTPAPRPAYSALCSEKTLGLGIAPLSPLNEALEHFVRRLPKEP